MIRNYLLAALAIPLGSVEAQTERDSRLPQATHEHRVDPTSPEEIVVAQPFQLQVPMEFRVAGAAKKVTRGFVLVLKVSPWVLEPRSSPDFVLFAGDAVAQRMNVGCWDGHLVALVPEVDLSRSPVWFGSRLLEERITATIFQAEQAAAEAAGISALAAPELSKARSRGGDTLEAYDSNELCFLAAPWILEYAPSEEERALSLRPGRAAIEARQGRGLPPPQSGQRGEREEVTPKKR